MKSEPVKLIYRDFKNVNIEQFKSDICNSVYNAVAHSTFENSFISVLNKHAPKNTKILRGNQKPQFIENLRKQMIRSHLKKRLISQKILMALPSLSNSKTLC